MTLLPRCEQERIALQFEREYGALVMLKNNNQKGFSSIAGILAREITNIAKPCYFEEDIIRHLVGISKAIKTNTIASSNNSKKPDNSKNITFSDFLHSEKVA